MDDRIEAVKKVQKYIEGNLTKRLTLFEIAQYSGYSPWHISKLFREYTGKTIFEYLRSLRLSKAALMLRDTQTQVIDVALEFIFDTHEGFTRAFSRQFGINPKQYSMRTPPIKLFMPYPVSDYNIERGDKTMKEEKTNIIFSQVIERPARAAIIKRGIKATEYFEYCEEVGCDVWGVLCSVKGALYEPIGMWLPGKLIKPGTSQYVQGVEVPQDYSLEVPEGYELISLEPCKMMVFQGPKYDDDNFEEEILKVMQAIDEYDPTDFGFEWADDDAPRFQYAPAGSRGYIEARPVRQIV